MVGSAHPTGLVFRVNCSVFESNRSTFRENYSKLGVNRSGSRPLGLKTENRMGLSQISNCITLSPKFAFRLPAVP